MRLDEFLVNQGKVDSRSRAQDLIKRGKVRVGTKIITKPAYRVNGTPRTQILEQEQYVSRAGNKLASVADTFKLDFKDATVLDIGSSTGGFTDYALQHGAQRVIAVDVGTDQLHPKLRVDPRVELHEKTDIRDFETSEKISHVVADVSFISLTKILPAVDKMLTSSTQVVVMAKPQFEAEGFKLNNGVVRSSRDRKEILSRFESWLKSSGWMVLAKRDSELAGAKGNVERFYLLRSS